MVSEQVTDTRGWISNEVIAKLKAANPGVELHLLATEDGAAAIVCKKPGRAEFKRFWDMQNDPKQRSRCLEALLLGNLVHPGADEAARLFEEWPALLEKFADQLLATTGAEQRVVTKKL